MFGHLTCRQARQNSKQQIKMSLPSSTFTLNIGAPAADVVFGNATRNGNSVVYTAPSPQGDLEGRPSCRVSHERTRSGITKSLVQFIFPNYDSELNKYVGFDSVNLTLNRTGLSSTANGEKLLEAVEEFLELADVRAAIAQAII